LRCLPTTPATGIRHVPVEGIVLTDAELDHTLGIVLMRESQSLQLYLTHAVKSILELDTRLLPVTRSFAGVRVTEVKLGERTELHYRDGESSGIRVKPISVPAGPPRFASTSEEGHTVGLLIEDATTGGICAYLPGCGDLSQALLDQLGQTDLVLFDGTFWRDDELVELGISDRRARDMDHMPVSGPDGSLVRLTGISRPQKLYTHINNTNPMLLEDSPERAAVDQAGLTVGSDGMRFTI
jgi:pyrroloquinoline quinone biosynthesis protein B